MQLPFRRSSGLIVMIVMLLVTYSSLLLCKRETVTEIIKLPLPATRTNAFFRFKLRKESLKRACAQFRQFLTEKEKQILYATMVVDDEHRLIWCPVRKSGTRSWRSIMLILAGWFLDVKEALDHAMHHDFQYLTRLSKKYHSKADIEWRLKNYTKFMSYREPLQRVVSDYRQIRLHKTAGQKKVCKWVVQYNKRFNRGKNKRDDRNNISFPHFVNYITRFYGNKVKYLDLNIHWRPINLICHPCHIDYDFLVDMDSTGLAEESDYLLRSVGAPSWLHLPHDNRSGNETKYSFLAQLSTAQFQRLRDQYDDDYEIFGYQRLNQHE
ncbi:carbohydrate sulfotransferase 8-like [Corticium candelabrum]|uniref:carbohydrate sulfotransferase 8-like n=1 Tax=Corticium candelabrum TaxID=121492 RepID=UPI002E26FD89|nr:carbohydrate sulfotransferase 8-like [Corticium candelabrum]